MTQITWHGTSWESDHGICTMSLEGLRMYGMLALVFLNTGKVCEMSGAMQGPEPA